MAKPAKTKKRAGGKPEQKQSSVSAPNWPILILALVGLGLAGYLTGVTWSGERAAFCEAGADCDLVLSSRWSTLLGLPTSLWGFLVYAALAVTAFGRRIETRWKWAVVLALFGFLYSAYLTTISVTQLEATCPYCITSLGLLTLILGVTLYQTPARTRRFSPKPWLATSLVGTAVLVGGVHYVFYTGSAVSASTNEDPWIRGLAEHLDKVGAKFYGAFWCPHCQEQKELFGVSAKRLPYIECSPSGRRGPQASECRAAGIRSYPTWIISGRRYSGVLTPSNLAEYTAYPGVTPPKKTGG